MKGLGRRGVRCITLQVEDTFNAVQSFPKRSSASPSDIRPRHIQDALIPGHQDEAVRQLMGVTQLLLTGAHRACSCCLQSEACWC
eukprot:871378-Amphidinium_carterae.1